ncbi:MAG: nuclear transport factor 2 family protein [Sideroxydans sp.]|nr:nuclear transport factor 2 family protein [Sideroxydans sp.]
MNKRCENLVAYFENLHPVDVTRMADFYADDAYFCDPFNEVNTLAEIQKIFRDMFAKLQQPRFKILNTYLSEEGAVLVWEFSFQVKFFRSYDYVIHGNSVLKFDAHGKVHYHRDYWDSSAELYAKLPLIGALFRGLRRVFAS